MDINMSRYELEKTIIELKAALESKETLLEAYRDENAKLKEEVEGLREFESDSKQLPIALDCWKEALNMVRDVKAQRDTANKRLGEYRGLTSYIKGIHDVCCCGTCDKIRELEEVKG